MVRLAIDMIGIGQLPEMACHCAARFRNDVYGQAKPGFQLYFNSCPIYQRELCIRFDEQVYITALDLVIEPRAEQIHRGICSSQMGDRFGNQLYLCDAHVA